MSDSPSLHKTAWMVNALTLSLHVLAVLTVASLGLWIFTDMQSIEMYMGMVQTGALPLNTGALGLHVGLSAALWGMMYGAYRYIMHARRPDSPKRVLLKSQGAVMLETLIAIWPFLLLVSGLAQLSMVNVAGVLADMASFQGARSVMVWQPELDINRSTISRGCNSSDSVCNRAKVSAALIMTPASSSDFKPAASAQGSGDASFRRARAVMVAGFKGGTGEAAYDRANSLAGGMKTITGENLHFYTAFDTGSLNQRAARKFTNAYTSLTEFNVINTNDRVGVSFVFGYQILFPWFGHLWGERRGAYYIRDLNRSYTLPKQPEMK